MLIYAPARRDRKLCGRILTTAVVGILTCTLSSCSGGGSPGSSAVTQNNGQAPSSASSAPPSPTITSVSVSPRLASILVGGTQSFTATVAGTGAFDSAVSWSVNGVAGGSPSSGTITVQGFYTAPDSVLPSGNALITATSTADPTKSGSAVVTITPFTPTITSISPSQGRPGDEIQISGNFGPLVGQIVVFSGPNGLSIERPFDQSAPTLLTVRVPLEAMTGPIFVNVPTGNGNVLGSNAVPFTRLPDLRIRALKKDLSAGETESFQARFFGNATALTVIWSADQGTITSNGTYTAPSSLGSDTFARVNGCIAGTQTCDTVLLQLHPFRIDPDAPATALGSGLQLQALAGATPVGATWTQITGGGTLLPNGAYTASSSMADGGGTLISASFQGVKEQTSISVTGGFPGLVNRVYDYLNSNQIQRATMPASVAVAGNRLYVLAAQDDAGALDHNFFYIDVYDLTDPVHPQWVDSVEAACAGQIYAFGGILYNIDVIGAGNISSPTLAAYNITGGSPLLIAQRSIPLMINSGFNQGVFDGVEQQAFAADATIAIDQFSLVSGNLAKKQILLPPALNGVEFSVDAVVSTASRLYITEIGFFPGTTESFLVAYDTTTNPASLIASVPLNDLSVLSGAFIANSNLYTDNKVFDISADPPRFVGQLPPDFGLVINSSGNALLESILQEGLRVIDASNPAKPVVTADLFDLIDTFQVGVLAGNHVYTAEQAAGVGVYDVSAPGGQRILSRVINSDPSGFVPVAQAASSTTLFIAGSNALGSGLIMYDLQQQPVAKIGTYVTPSSPNAAAIAGNTLYVGTDQALLVLDVSKPSTPSQISSLNLGIDSLSTSGNLLFVGTLDNRLFIFDVSTPKSPVLRSIGSLPDLPLQFANSGNLLLIADRAAGLLAVDVSIPASPSLVSRVPISPAAFGVQVDGNLALVAGMDSGLVIIDLSTPSKPQLLSQTVLGTDNPFAPGLPVLQNRAATVALENKIAFIGAANFDTADFPNNGGGMVYGFDYRNPQQPRLVSLASQSPALSGSVFSLFTVGTNLFVGGYLINLLEIDTSQPRNTIELDYPPPPLSTPIAPPPPLPGLVR